MDDNVHQFPLAAPQNGTAAQIAALRGVAACGMLASVLFIADWYVAGGFFWLCGLYGVRKGF